MNYTKIKAFILICLLTLVTIGIGAGSVQAAIEEPCPDGYRVRFTPGSGPSFSELCADHQTGTPTADSREAEREQAEEVGVGHTGGDCRASIDPDYCSITKWVKILTNVLAGIVGVVIVIMVVMGGLQYMTSRDNPQAVTAAKQRITNAVLALVVYVFIFAILEWLIPGGLF